MSFNQQLAALRKARGISQENLADMLGVSRQAVSKWETGETQPEMANLLALCSILEVSPNQLMGWEAEDTEEAASETAMPPAPRKMSKFVVAVSVICVCVALAAGILIGKGASGPAEPSSPLEGRESIAVTSFIYDFRPGQILELKMTFMPTIADESLTYEIIRLDNAGNTKTYEASYKDGVCVADVETIGWDWATYNLRVSDGENFLSCPLFKVKDDNDYSYTHEELWNQ